MRAEGAPGAPAEAGDGTRGVAGADQLTGDGERELLAGFGLPDHEAAAGVGARPAGVALAVFHDRVPAHRAGPEVGFGDANVLERVVEHLHGLPGEAGDVLHEALAGVLAALDRVEAVLPLAGQFGGGEGVAAEQAHDVEALLGGDEGAPVALDVADLVISRSMIAARVAGVPIPESFIASRSSSSSTSLPAVSIAPSSEASE